MTARPERPGLRHFAVEYLLALPAGALVALVWANAAPESYYRLASAVAFYVNDVAMVVFFALITKEIVEATAPGGLLHARRALALPLAAAAGATLAATLAHVQLAPAMGEPMLVRAWAVPSAIDLAVAYFVARAIFGAHPAVPFLLIVAIAANGIGFALLAAVEPTRPADPAAASALMALALAAAGSLRWARVRSFWPYVAGPGGLSWLALHAGGLHPALALAPIVPFLPHARRDPGFFVDARPGARDALSRLELWCRHPAQVALFFFGLVNAGVQLHALEVGAWVLPLAVTLGKPLGLLAAVAVLLAAGLRLPRGMTWRDLVVVALIGTVGFSMALFFATATLGAGEVLDETKTGAFLTLLGGGLAFGAAWMLGVGRFAPRGRWTRTTGPAARPATAR